MTTGMAWEKDHFTISQFSGQKLVRRRTEWRFDLDPFLVRKPFDMIEATASDDADTMCSHQGYNSIRISDASTKFLRVTQPMPHVWKQVEAECFNENDSNLGSAELNSMADIQNVGVPEFIERG